MCGIFGYTGYKLAAPIILEGLKRLEYRGYDSCGIATVDVNSGGLEIRRRRKVGPVAGLSIDGLPGLCGIGHTRWATHGGITKTNAHPHIAGNIAIVHNGIVSNFHELRHRVIANGARIESQTDTEIIAHLIHREYNKHGGLLEAMINACKEIEGHNAIAVICEDNPEEIVCARIGNAGGLIVGFGNDGVYVSSDIQALSGLCREARILESGAVVEIFQDGIGREYGTLTAGTVSGVQPTIGKDRMLAEIEEQVEVSRRWMAYSWPYLSTEQGLVLLGCGTSYHAALIGRHYIEQIAEIPTRVELAGEFITNEWDRYDVLAITQSGETADVLLDIQTAKQNPVRILTLTNSQNSEIARISDKVYPMLAGPEVAVAATKSFTASIMALYALAGGEREDISGKIRQALLLSDEIRELAKILLSESRWLVLGRGLDWPLALEAALKFKEIAYLDAHGHSGAEMKHGPIALIEKGTPVLAICTDDDQLDKMRSHIEQVRARGARVLAVTRKDDDIQADWIERVPAGPYWLQPVITAIPLQLLAYWLAIEQGIDPDRPRNLAKSVTVE